MQRRPPPASLEAGVWGLGTQLPWGDPRNSQQAPSITRMNMQEKSGTRKTKRTETLTADVLRRTFEYDPHTGAITRILKTGRRKPVSSVSWSGYILACVEGVVHMGHRLAWCLHYGRWPVGEIDHINGVRSDNRISNLRECSHRQNTQNQPARKSSRSGIRGVSPRRKRWRAQINEGRRNIHLGTFDTFEEARAVFQAALQERAGDFYPRGRI